MNNPVINLPKEIIDLIFEYSDIKCINCSKRMNYLNNNYICFETYNSRSSIFCSIDCYEKYQNYLQALIFCL